MATPQSTASQEDPSGDKKLEQITFRFCSECSNMLYPKEDEDAHKLQFTCRTCQYTEEATSTCVFRNVLNNSAGETAGVTQDVGSDPTVSDVLPVFCLTCGAVISCELCPFPAVFLSAFKREEKQEGNMGMAHFILGLNENNSDDPFAEYDEEPDNDDEDRLINGDSGYATTVDSNHSAGEGSDTNGGSADEDDTAHFSDESRRTSGGDTTHPRDATAMVVRF